MAKSTKANELRLIRAFSAPVNLVWDTFIDDKHISQWWGPRGFTLTTQSKDVRPGGKWIYTMHGPDGVDYPNIATYHEVKKYSKLIYDHGGNEERPKLFTMKVLFEEYKDKTVLDMTMTLDTPQAAAEIKKFIKQAGGDATWDRMAEYLEEQQTKKDIFVINRTFEADIKTVFDMWTNPEHLARWLPPTGASMKFLTADIKAGGVSHYEMMNADGSSMFGKIFYKEISPPSQMIYTQSFCDEKGKMCKPLFAPTWPDAMLTTVKFTDEGANETRVTVQWEIYGEATPGERNTFHTAKAGMTGGWTGSFDKLENALK